jgi:HAD superfamily hydrolase (TIGR01549 family)
MSDAMRVPRTPVVDPINPPPSLVLFDLDDTLCDYAGARAGRLRAAFTTALAHRGDDTTSIDLDQLVAESIAIHPHASDHFGTLLGRYGVIDPEVIQQVRGWYHTNRFLGLRLFGGAVELLQAIRDSLPGRRIGLVTNGPAEVQRDKIALLELLPSVDFALISGEFGTAKPEPAIFEEALRLGNACAGEAIMIGDSPEFDIAGARAANIRAVWVNRTGADWPGAPPPPFTVRSFAEIATMLGVSIPMCWMSRERGCRWNTSVLQISTWRRAGISLSKRHRPARCSII